MKLKIFLSCILTFFLLFGCIQLEMDLNVEEDGTASTSMLVDFSGIKDMQGMMGGLSGEDSSEELERYSKENICDTLLESMEEGEGKGVSMLFPSDLEEELERVDVSCVAVDDFVARLNYPKIDLVERGVLVIEELSNKKIFTLTFPPSEHSSIAFSDFNDWDLEDSFGDDFGVMPTDMPPTTMPDMGPEMFEMMGMSMKMNITMPGKIVSVSATDFGVLNDEENRFTLNLLRDAEKFNEEGLVIVSEKESSSIDQNLLLIGLIVGVVIIILIVGGFLFLKKKNSPQPIPKELFQEKAPYEEKY